MSKQVLLTVIIFNSLVLFVPIAMFLLYRRPQLWSYLFAVFLGVITGWLNLTSSEVQVIALLLLAFGLFLGFAQPLHAWRWALILAMWVPLGALLSVAMGFKLDLLGEVFGSFIAFVPAFIGVYCGVLVNRAAGRVPNEGGITG